MSLSPISPTGFLMALKYVEPADVAAPQKASMNASAPDWNSMEIRRWSLVAWSPSSIRRSKRPLEDQVVMVLSSPTVDQSAYVVVSPQLGADLGGVLTTTGAIELRIRARIPNDVLFLIAFRRLVRKHFQYLDEVSNRIVPK